MGFGLLFLGYLITFVGAMTPVYAFTQVFGVLLMVYALSKLSIHNRWFKITLCAGLLYVLQSFYTLLVYVMGWGTDSVHGLTVQYSNAILVFTFHALLLVSIRRIAMDTELPKLKIRAVSNMITTAVYCVLTVLPRFGWISNETVVQYVALASVLLGVLWLILNASLIFSCYMWICFEGEENMEKSPINIPFLNTINDAMNRGIDKMAQRRAEKDRDYINTKNRKKK